MNLEFKEASIENIEEIIKLCNECFNENTSLKYALKIFLENCDDKNQIYLIGIVNKEVVAHLKINIIPTIYEKMGTYAILNHVCVKKEYRRHGIGTKLLEKAFEISKEHNCKCVELWARNERVGVKEFYNNSHFEVMDAKFFIKEFF